MEIQRPVAGQERERQGWQGERINRRNPGSGEGEKRGENGGDTGGQKPAAASQSDRDAGK